ESRRWLHIYGNTSIQPSEIMKVVLILVYGWYFDRFRKQLSHPLVLGGAFLIALIPIILVLKEPDLSTTLVLCSIVFACTFAAGVNKWVITAILALAALGVYILYSDAVSPDPRFLNDYQVDRILAWLNPEEYSLTLAYQSIRSRMAIGSGGLLGKGLFCNAGLVPVATTDFIFGIIGEELGLLGGSFVILWIFLISGRVLSYALFTENLFKRIIYAGTAVMIAFQSLVHIGVNLAVLPNTGIPLPFVSYGLSSLTAGMAAIGLVIRLRSEDKAI
ncbi:MAG: FtsW/RodA/SpoVE family cell cycle protein, partial [Lachnospiraceae bacterium]|nr:FtsW/RodA/SpoVE family cell cycle protein [Lachnospiraceae bacterium]